MQTNISALSAAPLEGALVRLVLLTPEELKLVASGGRLDWYADGYPRQDDSDAAKMWLRAGEADRVWSVRHVIRRSDGLAVGSIGFFGPPDENGEAEIGYGLVESARRQGLISDAIALSVAAAEAAGARVIAHTAADNLASQGALLKAGFVRDDGENEDGEWRYARPA
ncbi:GNAT family N-acetyltransferase [Fodinicola acaciae]|uniref:GNAT family N-acetyltransferase n=1 Tax=Fodinicola acaciae TaxID=2681555 RepID=UPI0013D7EC38|nr:GNAT family N-acetyltransferase [Fodinicola acaciae]